MWAIHWCIVDHQGHTLYKKLSLPPGPLPQDAISYQQFLS